MLRLAALFTVALLAFPLFSFAALTPEERVQLEAQLVDLEKQIDANKTQLTVKQQERQSLERDVAVLDGQIKNAQLAIKQRELTIRKLNDGVVDKEVAIEVLDEKVAKGEESLAQMLRRTREIDEITMVELTLGGSISDLFTEVDAYQAVQHALDEAFQVMALLRADLSDRKAALLAQQSEEEELKNIQVYQRRTLEQTEAEKEALVKAAKGEESLYQGTIAAQQRTITEIRARLFELRDSSAIPFGTAYEYAKSASAATGVRPALILGILTQETNLGENVGTGNWQTDMHPDRDRPVFAQLMAELGFNPDDMKVSKKPWYGWGGAMGPSQFIPSTWVLYKERIASATGQNPPNPWDPRTAIHATGLLMKDNGADEGGRSAERRAALRYFAGGNWNKPAYAFYGDDVMQLTDRIQSEIDVLEGR